MLTLVQTSRLICPDSSPQSPRCKFLLKLFLQLCPAGRVATSTWMPCRTHVPADKNMAFKLGHGNMLHRAIQMKLRLDDLGESDFAIRPRIGSSSGHPITRSQIARWL